MKHAKHNENVAHRSSQGRPRTARGLWAEGPILKIRDGFLHHVHQLSTMELYIWEGERGQRRSSASALGDSKATRERQSCHRLVTGTWKHASLTGKEHRWPNKSNFDPRNLCTRCTRELH